LFQGLKDTGAKVTKSTVLQLVTLALKPSNETVECQSYEYGDGQAHPINNNSDDE